MGVDLALFEQLAELSSKLDAPQRTLMLGRQKLRYRGRGDKPFNRALAKAGSDKTIDQVAAEDGYAEGALTALGYGQIEALDASAFEGAQHIHDLNEPIPDSLTAQFDVVFDGGTIEHIFDVPAVFENVLNMLKPGGVFVSANGMNGWWGHGLYQFGPDLVWSFWERGAGCEVLVCRAVPAIRKFPPVDLTDPARLGRRLKNLGQMLPESRVYLYYAVRKGQDSQAKRAVQQSDYSARWARFARRG